MAAVDLIAVGKQIGAQPILEHIDLAIDAGEFIVVVGPSGCGKSTLLRLIAGLEEISSGQILINHQCVNTIPPAQRDIAMVFQNYALYPHMTVYQNMAYGLRMRGLPVREIDVKVKQAAEMLRLTPYLDRKPAALSGGQRQRVAMGRAMVRQPALFLFDEPLSNLDAKLRNEMRYEIKKLHQKLQTTSLYVTHDQTEAMTMADRVVILNQGRIEQIDRPQVLYDRPATAFVASFTGHYPMNFMTGRVDEQGLQVETEQGLKVPLIQPAIPLHPGMAVQIGIRPEDIILDATAKDNQLRLRIEFIDYLGSDQFIQTRLDNHQMRLGVRVPGDWQPKGETVMASLPTEQIHLFCAATGRRI